MKHLILLLIGISCISPAVYGAYGAVFSADYMPKISGHPYVIATKEPFYIMIYAENIGSQDIIGYSMPLRLYDPSESICAITHRDVGGFGDYGSIFMESYYQDYWDLLNQWTGFSWNAYLPDTINHTTAAVIYGWPPESGCWPSIFFCLQIANEGILCIDSVSIPNQTPPGKFDWLFTDTSFFSGPYCWAVQDINYTLDGNIRIYNIINGDYENFAFLEFQILSANNSGDTILLATPVTDANGHYEAVIPFTNAKILYKFSSTASSNLFPVYYYVNSMDEEITLIYDFRPYPIQGDKDTTISIDIGLYTGIDPEYRFNLAARLMRDAYITDSIMSLYQVYVDNIPIRIKKFITAYWEHSGLGNYIYMDYYNWYNQLVCHEVGHQIDYQLHDGYPRPPSPFDGLSHRRNSVTDTLFAFTEGWAHFIRAISSVPDTEIIYGAGNGCYETNVWWMGPDSLNDTGQIVEGAVASMLFDLYDNDSNPLMRYYYDMDDNVLNTGYMMPIILDCIRLYDPPVQTLSFGTLANRLVSDTNRYWHDDVMFNIIREDICSILKTHHFTPAISNKNYCINGNGVIEEDHSQSVIPNGFCLFQNYPNPFNAVTIIDFSIPMAGDCILEIYNILGEQVFSEEYLTLSKGHNSILIDNSITKDFSSGIYLYKLRYGNEILSRKMMLLK